MRTSGITLWTAVALAFGCGGAAQAEKKDDAARAAENRAAACEADRDNKVRRVQHLEQELDETQTEREKFAKESRRLETELAGAKADLNSRDKELASMRSERVAYQKRLEANAKLTDRFRKLADTGRLKIDVRNGLLVLRLPTEVLFAPGEARLEEEGLAGLAEMAGILGEFRDRRFIVAGHADSQEIYERRPRRRGAVVYKNGWDLSTARAVTVVEFLVEAGFPAAHLAAAGFGDNDPIAENNFAGDRALNRRIEIILLPDLSELPGLAKDVGAK